MTYNGAYRAVGTATGAALSGPVIAWTLLALLFVVVPVAYGARGGLREVDVSRKTVIVSLVWLALALASFVVQGRFLAHYAIPLAIPLGVAGRAGRGCALGARACRALGTDCADPADGRHLQRRGGRRRSHGVRTHLSAIEPARGQSRR